jgi:selenocysteine lyase/cysteine desulfurase
MRLEQATNAIRAYKSCLPRALLDILEEFTPRQVAEELGKHEIFVWDGNYYAISVTESLGVEESGGMVRPQNAGIIVGPVHYNMPEEIHKFGEVLGEIATS